MALAHPSTPPGRIVAQVRPAHVASRQALVALLQRDLTVLRKNLGEFVTRTLVQPFLLVFVFLYVFPTIGQGIGSTPRAGQSVAQAESVFATILVAGVVGIAVMFQGIQAVAMQMAQEFGYTREIEDRVQAPCPVWLVAVAKVLSGAIQGMIAALIVFPVAAVIHARGVHAHLTVDWPVLITVLPLACLTFSSLGLFLGTKFEPRNLVLMFGFVVLPITFLGGTYYAWTALRPVHVGSVHWLQILVLINPLIYVTEGMRAALTNTRIFPDPHDAHMHLYVVYPALLAALGLFLFLGLRGFRRRVLS
jgi:ABC-2 type transport system permease protein